MPWKGVTVDEERQRFLEDYRLGYYSIAELAEGFGIPRKTAHTHPGHQGKWIDRFEQYGRPATKSSTTEGLPGDPGEANRRN